MPKSMRSETDGDSTTPPHPYARAKVLTRALPKAPELVPARMVNEVLYCERLMYLEWAQGEFTDNHFTVEGRFAHRRADEPGGRLPPLAAKPAAAGTVQEECAEYQARSIWLTSERLGLTAKVDVVEGNEQGRVVPIEYKRGHVPEVPEGAYLPERAQVCAQALLLRDQGYLCDEGAIYFAAARRRVPVALSEELVATTLTAIARAREVAQLLEAPPPLEDSPKCLGCSLSGICLPDEVFLLKRLQDSELEVDVPLEVCDAEKGSGVKEGPADAGFQPRAQVRRLYPARDDRVPLYVSDPRTRVRISASELVIQGTEETIKARITNTSQVVIMGNAQVTTQALRALMERGVNVSFHTAGGWFLGRVSGAASNNIDLKIAQYNCAGDTQFSLKMARAFVVGKIKNCRTLVRRNADADAVVYSQLSQLARKASKADSLEMLLGLEGVAARTYFSVFSRMLKDSQGLGAFDFSSRNRRPPKDPVNALLSFAYSLLTREVTHSLAGVGLEPLLGFYHQPRFGRPALALDLMEEFRPLVADSVVITAVNTGVITERDFVFAAGSCSLTAPARRRFIAAYERRMDDESIHPWFGYRVSYRRLIEVQARLLSRVILGELENYPAFTTR